MNSYSVLSEYYDRFTDDVPYEKWVEYFEAIFKKEGLKPHLVLDLACGTGTITKLLAQKGYEMIGCDLSVEMLTQAMNKTLGMEHAPIFLNQSMDELDLYGTIDACVCCLDSLNYITNPGTLEKAFKRVSLFMEPDGIFIFDVNTRKKLEAISGQSFVREDGDVFCVWQAVLDGEICSYDFDIFENTKDNRWERYKETHRERIYDTEELKQYLTEAGFSDICVYPELGFEPLKGDEHRLFFTARKRI